MAKRTSRRQGFTLIEVLVAAMVSIMLALLVVGIFISSERAVSATAGTLEMISDTRPTMARLARYMTSAVTLTGEEDTVVYPPVGSGYQTEAGDIPVREQPSTWTKYLVFRSSEDFLDPNPDPNLSWNPNRIWEIAEAGGAIDSPNHRTIMATFENEAYDIFDYLIWFEEGTGTLNHLPNEDKVLVIARLTQERDMTDPDQPVILRPSEDYRVDEGGDPWSFIDPAAPPRVIGRGLESVSFHMLVPNGVYVSCLARKNVLAAGGGTVAKEFRAEGMIQIPSISMQQ
jgi:hypothetical protein